MKSLVAIIVLCKAKVDRIDAGLASRTGSLSLPIEEMNSDFLSAGFGRTLGSRFGDLA